MDIIRRNTDYCLRLAVALVKNFAEQRVSARQLSETCNVPYQLACKLLQKLAAAKIAKSTMGSAGGFELAGKPGNFTLYQIVAAVQGDICVSNCVPKPKSCHNSQKCKIRKKLIVLQKYIDNYLKRIKLSEL